MEETLSDKIEIINDDGFDNFKYLIPENVKRFIKDLKQEIRGIPIKDGYQDIIEIWRRIDKLAGEKLI